MWVLKRSAPAARPAPHVVGYVNRRTGEVVCLEHGGQDVMSPRTTWVAVELADRSPARYEATAPLICNECGAWLNNESTCYANVSSYDDYWKRWLRSGWGHRNG